MKQLVNECSTVYVACVSGSYSPVEVSDDEDAMSLILEDYKPELLATSGAPEQAASSFISWSTQKLCRVFLLPAS